MQAEKDEKDRKMQWAIDQEKTQIQMVKEIKLIILKVILVKMQVDKAKAGKSLKMMHWRLYWIAASFCRHIILNWYF